MSSGRSETEDPQEDGKLLDKCYKLLDLPYHNRPFLIKSLEVAKYFRAGFSKRTEKLRDS